jgi:hypothetical protein
MHTANAGDWFERSGVSGPRSDADSQVARMEAVLDKKLSAVTGYGITRLPDGSSVTNPNARGRRIAVIGKNANQFIFTQNRNQQTWNDFIELPAAQGGDGVYRSFVDYSRQDPDIVYAGANVSLNGGTTWSQTQHARPICGMSMQNGNTVYGLDGDDRIVKSTNRGESWLPFFGPVDNLKVRVNFSNFFWVSPHDHTRTFVRNANGDVLMVHGTPGSIATTDLRLRNEFNPVPFDFDVKTVAFSGQDPRLIYALLDMSGNEVVWRGQFNAGYTSVDWTPITKNAPRIAMSSSLFVHPTTGDVFLSSGLGTWVHPPPGGPGAQSVWNNLPRPFPNGWTN